MEFLAESVKLRSEIKRLVIAEQISSAGQLIDSSHKSKHYDCLNELNKDFQECNEMVKSRFERILSGFNLKLPIMTIDQFIQSLNLPVNNYDELRDLVIKLLVTDQMTPFDSLIKLLKSNRQLLNDLYKDLES